MTDIKLPKIDPEIKVSLLAEKNVPVSVGLWRLLWLDPWRSRRLGQWFQWILVMFLFFSHLFQSL